MVTEEEMTVWIQSVWSCETVKDQIVVNTLNVSLKMYLFMRASYKCCLNN